MSKSKKNTVDPEKIINQYGADAVRWFILSDSPPEKDVMWSDTGVAAANKFLQKVWNLSLLIVQRDDIIGDKKVIEKFNLDINSLVYKIDKSIEEFKFNVAIAHFYEAYKIFNSYLKLKVDNEILKKNIIKFFKLIIPFAPHLAYECLELLKCETTNNWPEIKNNFTKEIKIAVQINGKTRDVINISSDMGQEQVNKWIEKNSKAKNI